MKKTHPTGVSFGHSPEQIIDILRQVERESNQGKTAAEACRALGIREVIRDRAATTCAMRSAPHLTGEFNLHHGIACTLR